MLLFHFIYFWKKLWRSYQQKKNNNFTTDDYAWFLKNFDEFQFSQNVSEFSLSQKKWSFKNLKCFVQSQNLFLFFVLKKHSHENYFVQKTCTKTFIASNCRISKLNLARSASRICKTAIINIIIQINSSD